MDITLNIVPSLAPLPGPFDGYPGGKGSPGVYQTIINNIPLHTRYYEPFVGGGEIFRRKKLAFWNFIGDRDLKVCTSWVKTMDQVPQIKEKTAIYCESWLNQIETSIKDTAAFIFLDPPYLGSVRSSKKDIYKHEMKTEAQHTALLEFITHKRVKANVMICGYYSELYDHFLQDWHLLSYQGCTRSGAREECIWMNYNVEALALHDYRYWGQNKRKREDTRQKVRRWVRGLDRMNHREREAIIQAIKKAEPCWRAS